MKRLLAPILLLTLLAFCPGLQAQTRAFAPSADFKVVESSFRQGDSLQVKSLRRSHDRITLLVNYVLGSEDQALLYFSIAGNAPTKLAFDPRQRAAIKKGQGTVMLHFPHAYPGLPCVSLNQAATNRLLGHLYFGNEGDIAAARMPGVGRTTPSDVLQMKLAKIILPQVGCENASPAELFEYLSIKARDNDFTTSDLRLKGVPIMVTSTRKDSATLSLDLQNIPLGEAIRQAAKLGGFSVTYTDTGVVIGDAEGMAQASPEPNAPGQPAAGAVFPMASPAKSEPQGQTAAP